MRPARFSRAGLFSISNALSTPTKLMSASKLLNNSLFLILSPCEPSQLEGQLDGVTQCKIAEAFLSGDVILRGGFKVI